VLDRERRPSYKPSAQVKRGTEGETEDDPEEERRRGGEEERRTMPLASYERKSLEEEDTCVSHEEEDACMIKTLASYERESLMLLEGRRGEAERGRTRRVRGNRQREEDTCVSYEDDDTCMTKTLHVRGNEKKKQDLACQEKWAGGRRKEKNEGEFEFRV
jgi:hypothetical protein